VTARGTEVVHDQLAARTHYDMDRQFKRPPNEGDLL
jgi:hypothetical protein